MIGFTMSGGVQLPRHHGVYEIHGTQRLWCFWVKAGDAIAMGLGEDHRTDVPDKSVFVSLYAPRDPAHMQPPRYVVGLPGGSLFQYTHFAQTDFTTRDLDYIGQLEDDPDFNRLWGDDE